MKPQNYTWAKFSWSYSRLAARPLEVCRSSFVWKWDVLCLKITGKLEFNVKSRLSWVSTDSHFDVRDHFDAEIQSKTQDAEAGERQACINQNWKENFCIKPEKKNQASHLSGFSKKFNLQNKWETCWSNKKKASSISLFNTFWVPSTRNLEKNRIQT